MSMPDNEVIRLHERIDGLEKSFSTGFEELKTAIIGDTTGSVKGIRNELTDQRNELSKTQQELYNTKEELVEATAELSKTSDRIKTIEMRDRKSYYKIGGTAGAGGAGLGYMLIHIKDFLLEFFSKTGS